MAQYRKFNKRKMEKYFSDMRDYIRLVTTAELKVYLLGRKIEQGY